MEFGQLEQCAVYQGLMSSIRGLLRRAGPNLGRASSFAKVHEKWPLKQVIL